MKKPKVSIIIPVYNGKEYMKEAIDSALAQTYDNLEILVINDGSNDGGMTDKIAKSYGNKIKYIKKENGGVSTALNLALKEMTGDYFSWLSHDDYYYPEKVEKEIIFLNENNLLNERVILYSDYDLMNENGKVTDHSVKDHQMLEQKPEYALLRGTVNGLTLLIPKKAFKECGNFDESLRCVQDYDLWYKMMKKGYKFIHLPEILVITRIHSKQVTNTNPKVETEGNTFWINMIDDISLKSKIRLEGSEYNYYLEMANFLKSTPYHLAEEHCTSKYLEIEDKIKKSTEEIKVSVIIPFYNRIKLVVRAIKSVLNQTHKNYEILLVNDGSTDKMEELKDLIKKEKCIKLINVEPNKGAANARNIGIENATGDYIAFLDSDDEFEPNKLEIQLVKMIASNSMVSHTSYIRRGFNKEVVFNSGQQTGKMIPTLICSCLIATPTVMIKKKYLDDNNYRFDSNLVIGEDTCFWLTILTESNLLGIDIPLTIVNSNESSAAYNIDKQIIGIKTILRFVLNNPKLNKYDNEIALLATIYVDLVNQSNSSDLLEEDVENYYCPRCVAMINSRSWKLTKPLRWGKLFFKSLKTNGLRITGKKVAGKIRNKIKNK